MMYIPLSNYLVAKSSLNLNAIPELYTLLHSNDVHFKEHRTFILNLLIDGMKTKNSFEVALRSMAFKLVMEFYNSCLADDASKILILNFLRNTTKIPYAVKLLCSSYGFLPWLYQNLQFLSGDHVNKFLSVIVDILRNILKNSDDVDCVTDSIVYIVENYLNLITSESLLLIVLETVSLAFVKCSRFLNEELLRKITDHVGDKKCGYYMQYGVKFASVPEDTDKSVSYYLKKITLDYVKLNQK